MISDDVSVPEASSTKIIADTNKAKIAQWDSDTIQNVSGRYLRFNIQNQKGWKNSQRKPVKNSDLWKLLDEQNQRHQVDWQWVKGHSGHPENEKADELANLGIDNL